MAELTIISQPGGGRFALTKEQMVYHVRLSDVAQMQSAVYKRTITIDSAGTAGQTLTLTSNALLDLTGTDTYTLTVDAAGVEDGKVRAVGASQSVTEWIDENLLPALNGHSMLGVAYSFTRSAQRVVMTAKGYGASYALTLSGTLGYSLFSTQAGTDAAAVKRVRLEAKVYVTSAHNSGTYVESPWRELDMQIGDVWAELQHDFGPMVNDMIDELDRGQTNANYMRPTKSVRKGYIQFRAITDLVGASYVYARSSTLQLLKGGRKTNEQHVNYLSTYVGSFNSAPTRWLTGRRGELWTSEDAWDYLSFHARWQDPMTNNILVKYNIYYTNGDVLGNTLYTLTSSDVEQNQVVTIPAGFKQLNLDGVSSNTPYKYELMVEVNNVVVLRQMYMLLTPTDTGATLLYNNEFGLPEGLWLEGVREIEAKYDRELMKLAQPLGSLRDWSDSATYGRKLETVLNVRSRAMVYNDWVTYYSALLGGTMYLRKQGATRDYPVQLLPGSQKITEVDWEGNNVAVMELNLKLNDEQ